MVRDQNTQRLLERSDSEYKARDGETKVQNSRMCSRTEAERTLANSSQLEIKGGQHSLERTPGL